MPNLRNGSKGGFEPGLSRLRVRHSTTELPRHVMRAELESTMRMIRCMCGISLKDSSH